MVECDISEEASLRNPDPRPGNEKDRERKIREQPESGRAKQEPGQFRFSLGVDDASGWFGQRRERRFHDNVWDRAPQTNIPIFQPSSPAAQAEFMIYVHSARRSLIPSNAGGPT